MRIIPAAIGAALISVVAVGCSSQHAGTPKAAADTKAAPAASSLPASSPTSATGVTQPPQTTKPKPARPTAGWGTYRVTDPQRGTVYTISIRPGLDNAEVQQVQAYRRLTGYVKPVNYVTMTIDNTKGAETAWYSDLSIVSTAGKTYPLETASNEVDAIRQDITNEDDNTEINTGNAITDADWGGDSNVLPGAKSSVLMIGGADMPEPGRVFLDENEAHRAG
jgi:hypothetical protein